MKATVRPSLLVSADGRGVVSHAGSRLLVDLAERTTLTGELTAVLAGLARPRAVHDPGRVLVDLAVAVADGAQCISDIAVLADQPALFGSVASDSTVWRLLAQLGAAELAAVAAARAAARELAWAQRAELTGAAVPTAGAAGVELPGLVIDLDASIVVCHSEKEQAAATFKSTSATTPSSPSWTTVASSWPGCCGRATPARTPPPTTSPSWTPRSRRSPTRTGTVFRSWSAPTALAARRRSWPTSAACASEPWPPSSASAGRSPTGNGPPSAGCPPAWTDAVDAEGRHRDGAAVAELTGLLPAGALTDYPPGTRILIRRERPHPGAQLDAFEERDGWRYQCLATDTGVGQLAFLDARHRAHARVEDRIRCGKDTGLGRFPSRSLRHQRRLADRRHARRRPARLGPDHAPARPAVLAQAEPKTLRYRLLHVAARLVRGGRRLRLRLDQTWPWATHLAAAFDRCAALPQPAR